MKSIVFDYKMIKKCIFEFGDDDWMCDYFDEVDEVFGKIFGNSFLDVIDVGLVVI